MAGSRVFVVSGMPQLADYVYQDYSTRTEALKEKMDMPLMVGSSME